MLHPYPHEQRESARPIVELRDVTCGYEGNIVLSRINLSIRSGDFVGLLGPSGSGKTTLLRAILGATHLESGEVYVEGVSIKEKRPRVGYVPQLETIDWNFPVTVREVVLMGQTMNNKFFPWFKSEEYDQATEIMQRLGIGDLAKRQIRELSGGQQQRVFLARALVSNPSLLLLDEPTAGVDIKTRDDVMHLVDELNHRDITVIMTTHEINAVAAHLPWVVCLNGSVVAEGPPDQVFTPETLRRTYNADMPVIRHQGMTLVAERPHIFGREGQRSSSQDDEWKPQDD